MNRTDRLLAFVLGLQRHGKRRGEDLAATFKGNIRTIYFNVEALCQSGVPILSVTGQGYSLVEGYFLPPLSFDIDEVGDGRRSVPGCGRQERYGERSLRPSHMR